jgi:acetyltransferase-like isoleucine patch superfamily enzyme
MWQGADPVVRASPASVRSIAIRLLQVAALYAPGAMSLRVRLHRWRGVTIGDGSWISPDVLLETSRPELICIGNGVALGTRATVIAHFRNSTPAERHGDPPFSVRIEDEAFIGPGAIVLPGVSIGHGAVVTAGSVVTSSVPPLTVVQGNPARPVARCGIPLGVETQLERFQRSLKPLR